MRTVDALWVGDARRFYYAAARGGVDVVASRATFPADTLHAWGASLCMGLIAFLPSAAARALVRRAAEKCGLLADGCDDQKLVNEELLRTARVHWDPSRLARNGPKATGAGRLGNRTDIKLWLLPSSDVRRNNCENESLTGSVVVHCQAGKSGGQKAAGARRHHLWRLRAAWEGVERRPPLLAYLRNVCSSCLF